MLRGREDWLFWTGEGNIDDYQNAHPFSRADLEQIEGKLSAVQRRLAAQGIAFLVAPAPNKETIYPEMLPPEIVKIGKQSRLDQLLAYLEEKHSAVKVLDLRPVLLDNKAQHQLYYRTDTHWNDYGAYYASTEIFKALQRDFPQLQPPGLETYRLQQETISGDLARLLLTDPLLSEPTLQLSRFPRGAALEKSPGIQISELDTPAAGGIFRVFCQQPGLLSNASAGAISCLSNDWGLSARQPDCRVQCRALPAHLKRFP